MKSDSHLCKCKEAEHVHTAASFCVSTVMKIQWLSQCFFHPFLHAYLAWMHDDLACNAWSPVITVDI